MIIILSHLLLTDAIPRHGPKGVTMLFKEAIYFIFHIQQQQKWGLSARYTGGRHVPGADISLLMDTR